MENGFKIMWTDNALNELQEAYEYLENNWTQRELKNLSIELDRTLKLISENPKLFQFSKYKNIRRAIVKNYNTIFYRENEKDKIVEILSFFSNRKKPLNEI